MNELLGPRRQIRKFNPGTFQSDEELSRQFVVRERELGIVLEILHGNVGAPSCQHVLLVAPRGRGKTMLLARVAAELRTNREFSERLLPVRFMEESQEIFNLGDFWLETLFHLAREIGKSDPESSRELRDTHADLAARWRGKELEGHARAAALEATDRTGKQIVLMVENLQTLCGDVDADFGWKLRKTLQSEPRIILLATATSRFKGLDDAKEPFFELFRIVLLEPLDTERCRRLWQMASGDTVSEREIRPLEILTGGNPRLLVIVAGLAQHRSLHQLMENLVSLIDDHTEYFRSHLEGFAKTERLVYISVIDLWQPSSTGEVATRARMDVRCVSTLLGRLVNRGAVIMEGRGKKRQYAAAERLYSIYYKLRREHDEAAVVRNLIHFMTAFYSGDELAEMSGKLIAEAAQFPAIREGIDRAVAEMPQIGNILSGMMSPEVEIVTDAILRQAAGKMADALEEGKFQEVIEIVDRFFYSHKSDSSDISNEVTAGMIFIKALAYSEMGNSEMAIAIYSEVVERFSNDNTLNVQSTVVRALLNKGYQQGLLGEVEVEIEIYDEIVERFGNNDALVIQRPVAMALDNKSNREARFGKNEAAIATSGEIINRFGASDEPMFQVIVAKALFNIGYQKGEFDEKNEAILAYDEVVKRFGDNSLPKVQVEVAKALIMKGATQIALGETMAAIAAYDDVVERFEDSDESEFRIQIARALIGKGRARYLLGHTEEIFHICDELERISDNLASKDKVTFVWQAKWMRTKALFVQARYQAGMDALRSAYAAFIPENETMLREMLMHVLDLIAIGTTKDDLIEVLSSDRKKSGALSPLIVALQLHAGEMVRAPIEVLEIADDIRQRIEEVERIGGTITPGKIK